MAEPAVEETVHRAPSAPADDDGAVAPRRRALPFVIAAAVVLVLAGGGALVFALSGATSPAEESVAQTDQPVDQVDVGNATVPEPADLVATPLPDGSGTSFTWSNPDPQEGDSYRWAVVSGGQPGQEERVNGTTVTVPATGAAQTCIQVTLVRSDGKGSDPAAVCTP